RQKLLQPSAQGGFKPRQGLEDMVRQPTITAEQQQVARMLFSSFRPVWPGDCRVDDPEIQRRKDLSWKIMTIGDRLFDHAFRQRTVLQRDDRSGAYAFRPGLLRRALTREDREEDVAENPLGGQLTLDDLARLEPTLGVEPFARALTEARMATLGYWLAR